MDLIVTEKHFQITSPYGQAPAFAQKKAYFLDLITSDGNILQAELTTYPDLIKDPSPSELDEICEHYKQALIKLDRELDQTCIHKLEQLCALPSYRELTGKLPFYWRWPYELLALKRLNRVQAPEFLASLQTCSSPEIAGLLVNIDEWTQAPIALHNTWKLKLGRLSCVREQKELLAFVESYPHIKLRLDFNERLDHDEARQWAEFFAHHPKLMGLVELIEGWQDNHPELDQALEALDLRDPTILNPQDRRQLIVKPALLGLECTLLAQQYGLAQNRPIILSSCFETARGLSDLMQLAKVFQLSGPQGFGTLEYLHELPS
jgi:hypothetical protein